MRTGRIVLAVLPVAALLFVAPSLATGAASHRFRATYTGSGSGQATTAGASGSATLSGRGTLVGASTLKGSGRGAFTSQTCVAFHGRATIRGGAGSLKLAAHGDACTASPGATKVAFSGRATVTGGTASFAGARGNLSFTGKYVTTTDAVTLVLKGRVTY